MLIGFISDDKKVHHQTKASISIKHFFKNSISKMLFQFYHERPSIGLLGIALRAFQSPRTRRYILHPSAETASHILALVSTSWLKLILLKWMRSHSHNIDLPTVASLRKWQNASYNRFTRLSSENSTGVPAMLPCALQPRQSRENLRKQLAKPTVWGIL